MDRKTVNWIGEDGLKWGAVLEISGYKPVISELYYEKDHDKCVVAGPLWPEVFVTTGIRKPTGEGDRQSLVRSREEFYEMRWNTYADDPMGRTQEIRRYKGEFHAKNLTVRRRGHRIEAEFDGLSMGVFSGTYRITFYEKSNLIKSEAIASTREESLAYLYCGGFYGFHLGQLYYRTLEREMVKEYPRRPLRSDDRRTNGVVRVNARNRILTLKQEVGAVAVFPPPHKFFWARQNENCVGYNYYYRNADDMISMGVRHNERHEADGDRWACYNAPAGTWQHMPFFMAVSADGAETCRELAMRYTNYDVFSYQEGYKRMLGHFHMSYHTFWEQDPHKEQDWMKLFKEMGCDIAMLCDFWVDGEQDDNRDARRLDQLRYFEACRMHSNENFLIVPAEEIAERPNTGQKGAIPGHTMFVPSKPTLYSRHREKDQPFSEETPEGTYYHWDTPESVIEMCRRENAFIFLPHPETKANDGYPMSFEDEEFYNDPLYWGMGFRYLPSDWSMERLIDGRVSSVWDDMNNKSGFPRYIMGELDTYEKEMRWDMYGDMNVTYVKLDRIPSAEDWTPLIETLKAGEAYVTTGEILLEDCRIGDGNAAAVVSFTFPMEFAEVVYSDGIRVDSVRMDLSDTHPFESRRLQFTFPKGMKWARIAAWDVAGNGALHQPVFI